MAASLAPTDAGIAEAISELQASLCLSPTVWPGVRDLIDVCYTSKQNQIKAATKKDKELAAAWIHADLNATAHAHDSSVGDTGSGEERLDRSARYSAPSDSVVKKTAAAVGEIDFNREMSMMMSLNMV